MSDDRKKRNGKAVPFGRLSRFARFGALTANVAANAMFDGAQQMVSGKRPKLEDLLLTPSNMMKITDQLSNMRGAAMKLGQMMSMDSGDFLPRELADILAALRSEAQHMPKKQLHKVLAAEWGKDWESRFDYFSPHPIAAASIGQVHRATAQDGTDLAIKVQYPGVRKSIDSDVDNVSSLLKMTGILPRNLDITPTLAEAKKQLHEEADYTREAKYLKHFGELMQDDENFVIPEFYDALSTENILAMSYLEGKPIDQLANAGQYVRDRVAHLLISLLLRELFEFRLMQTDPNFANYQYDPKSKKIILLDFGASREISKEISNGYRAIMKAALSGDSQASYDASMAMGFIAPEVPQDYRKVILEMLQIALLPLQEEGEFDFGKTRISEELRDRGMELAANRDLWHLPPSETIFIQRKFSGVYMLASRLRARVDVRALMQEFV